MSLRLRYGASRLPGFILATAGVIAGSVAASNAFESSLAPPTSVKPLGLGGSQANGPQLLAVTAGPHMASGRTQWRASRQSASSTPTNSKTNSKPSSKTHPATTPAKQPAPAANVSESTSQKPAETPSAPQEINGPALTPSAESDEPIDELSETPAPSTDAPGDPVEPEDDSPAAKTSATNAKPLSQAPTMGDRARTPVGEPDRIAKPNTKPPAPKNPEAYEESDAAPTAKSAKLPPFSRNQRALRDKVRSVLRYYYERPLNTGDRSPWEVMHCMLSYEVHSRILQGGPDGPPITAVGWLCFNQPCKNRTLMYLNEDGGLQVKVGPALQGHQGQLLAILAQARVREDYPLKVEGKDFTIADLIEVEKSTCYPKTELTFKLIGLQRYLDLNARWVNDQGMNWDFPTLLREEMAQPVRTAACGGTHRLSGLTLTVKKRRGAGMPLDGAYAEAAQFVANYQNYAYRLQNPDGSFSTEWFKGPGAEADIDRRLKTTGHILEWLMYASSEEQLNNSRNVRAVNYLSNIMWANRGRTWEAGPLGHAIHSLVLYDRRAFSKYDAESAAAPVATRPIHPKR